MTKDNQKITIKYKEKEYEIEKTKDEQKVKPKDGKETDEEITIKDYNENLWNHTCQCNGEEIVIKWGIGKHASIWGGGSFGIVLFSWAVYYFGFKKKEEPKLAEDETE